MSNDSKRVLKIVLIISAIAAASYGVYKLYHYAIGYATKKITKGVAKGVGKGIIGGKLITGN